MIGKQIKQKSITVFPLLVLLSAVLVLPAEGAITTYTGLDAGVDPGGARPNSDAAAANFDAAAAALCPLSIEDFESAPIGNFANLVLNGVTVTLMGTASDANAGITNVTGHRILGYNTTSGGAKHLRFVPPIGAGTRTAKFSYAVPIQAWGAYFTGVGTQPNTTVTVEFNDDTAQSFGVQGASDGGASFFGFTDPGKVIASVTVQEVLTGSFFDTFSIDDVRSCPAGVIHGVGGMTDFLVDSSGSSAGSIAALAGGAAGAFVILGAGGWYARRRWLGRRS